MAQTLDPTLLAVAMLTADDDVSPASRINPASNTSQIAALALGECFSKSVLVDVYQRVGEFTDSARSGRDALRNALNSAVVQARKRTGNNYIMEISTLVTASSKLYNVAIVSRVE